MKDQQSGTSGSLPPHLILGTSDGPGTPLVSCLLNGTNYLTWSWAMLTAIPAKSRKVRYVRKYYSELKTLWDEFENLLHTPTCTFAAAITLSARRERERAHQFLMGLNPEYATICSTILSLDPMPNVNKIFAMLTNEEAQRAACRGQEATLDNLASVAISGGHQLAVFKLIPAVLASRINPAREDQFAITVEKSATSGKTASQGGRLEWVNSMGGLGLWEMCGHPSRQYRQRLASQSFGIGVLGIPHGKLE
ncbi:hypothetical protein CRG98_048044 [Punica granatum]|uniref:Retrotransposon Copia-like N-terminal domain-containing protein n=1 Tax=Punica granatum TaxID=22663 RepID=A0A2I0HJ83_PUNGR|nr:hypothetical protein CRG98_048044 [Punica granatum]